MKFGTKIPGSKDVYYTSIKIAEDKAHNKILQLLYREEIVATFSPYYGSESKNTWRLDYTNNNGIIMDPNGNYINTTTGKNFELTTEIKVFFDSMIKQFRIQNTSTKYGSGFTFGIPQKEM